MYFLYIFFYLDFIVIIDSIRKYCRISGDKLKAPSRSVTTNGRVNTDRDLVCNIGYFENRCLVWTAKLKSSQKNKSIVNYVSPVLMTETTRISNNFFKVMHLCKWEIQYSSQKLKAQNTLHLLLQRVLFHWSILKIKSQLKS